MKNELVGWDDGKLYFYDEKGKEYCVNDYKELLDKIVEMCAEYLGQEKRKEKVGGEVKDSG
ncbi:hypothetical protein KKH56_04845 [bacterium]|nr:hypothetical protein [bacterium]